MPTGSKGKATQTYAYKTEKSILAHATDDYQLAQEEYYRIYSFYVTYSMCGTQSLKKRSFTDYGWESNLIGGTDLGTALNAVLNLNKNKNFIFTDQDDLKKRFSDLSFADATLPNLDIERAVIGKTSEPNNYLRLFYRIRDAFAHGKYCLVFHPVTNEKMVVMEDNSPYNFTARLVLKLETIIGFINAVDKNGII